MGARVSPREIFLRTNESYGALEGERGTCQGHSLARTLTVLPLTGRGPERPFRKRSLNSRGPTESPLGARVSPREIFLRKNASYGALKGERGTCQGHSLARTLDVLPLTWRRSEGLLRGEGTWGAHRPERDLPGALTGQSLHVHWRESHES